MSLQKNILKEYRSHYPNDTLREISQRTGIQLTRVFRLLNGAPMKLSEYESFHEIVEHKYLNHDQFSAIKLIRNNAQKLASRDMKKICEFIQRKISLNELTICDEFVPFNNKELA